MLDDAEKRGRWRPVEPRQVRNLEEHPELTGLYVHESPWTVVLFFFLVGTIMIASIAGAIRLLRWALGF